MGYSVSFYFFCLGFRDGIRLFYRHSFQYLHFSGQELFVFNLFLAGVAICYGLNQAIHFWIDNQRDKLRIRHRNTVLGSLNFTNSTFLLALAKFSAVAGIMLIMVEVSPSQQSFNIVSDFSWLWCMIVIILFHQKWNELKRVYQLKPWYWISLGTLVVGSALLANCELFHTRTIQTRILTEEQVKQKLIVKELERAENWGLETSGEQSATFFSLIKNNNHSWENIVIFLSESDANYPSVHQLLFAKCAVKMGYWERLALSERCRISNLTLKILEHRNDLKWHLKMKLIEEILTEYQYQYYFDCLTSKAYNRLSKEDKVWMKNNNGFHNWERPVDKRLSSLDTVFNIGGDLFPDKRVLIDLGTLDGDSSDYILQMESKTMLELYSQIDSINCLGE